jgi:hypothetical protein
MSAIWQPKTTAAIAKENPNVGQRGQGPGGLGEVVSADGAFW